MSFRVLGRVSIYFGLFVVHCANPILLKPRKECEKLRVLFYIQSVRDQAHCVVDV